ncbi:hypothetical protein BaRGS_00018475, partial [Batillaria attramentaria]
TAPVTTLPNDPPKDPVLFLYGVDFMVVACVGIIAFAAVVIFVSVAAGKRKVRRGDEQRRSTEFVQSMQPYEEPRPDRHDIHQANNEEDSHSRFSQESSFYWEIRNDPPTPSPATSVPFGKARMVLRVSRPVSDFLTSSFTHSPAGRRSVTVPNIPLPAPHHHHHPTLRSHQNIQLTLALSELPRPCVWPALSDDYLHPVVSRRVKEGTDDSTTVTPLYENSVLR